MISTKGTQKDISNFYIGNRMIEKTREDKYLELTVNCKNCSFFPALNDLYCRGNRAMYALLSKISIKLTPLTIMLKLFDRSYLIMDMA